MFTALEFPHVEQIQKDNALLMKAADQDAGRRCWGATDGRERTSSLGCSGQVNESCVCRARLGDGGPSIHPPSPTHHPRR